MFDEPLGEHEAERLIRAIIKTGKVAWTEHVIKQMATRNLTTVDCVNVMRAGSVEPPEYESGSWRYRVSTARITVVVAFRSETELAVVTAWRNRQGGTR